MENKLEQLLNSLIQRGRKPFWKSNRWNVTIDKTIKTKSPFFDFDYHNMSVSTRELVSKESWLWQFVCENGMVKTYMNIEHESRRHSDKKHTPVWAFDNQSYYYLIESSLKDESELESFILDNIKV